jgi:hypothetical protein
LIKARRPEQLERIDSEIERRNQDRQARQGYGGPEKSQRWFNAQRHENLKC